MYDVDHKVAVDNPIQLHSSRMTIRMLRHIYHARRCLQEHLRTAIRPADDTLAANIPVWFLTSHLSLNEPMDRNISLFAYAEQNMFFPILRTGARREWPLRPHQGRSRRGCVVGPETLQQKPVDNIKIASMRGEAHFDMGVMTATRYWIENLMVTFCCLLYFPMHHLK